jgi:hypothetical protein
MTNVYDNDADNDDDDDDDDDDIWLLLLWWWYTCMMMIMMLIYDDDYDIWLWWWLYKMMVIMIITASAVTSSQLSCLHTYSQLKHGTLTWPWTCVFTGEKEPGDKNFCPAKGGAHMPEFDGSQTPRTCSLDDTSTCSEYYVCSQPGLGVCCGTGGTIYSIQ